MRKMLTMIRYVDEPFIQCATCLDLVVIWYPNRAHCSEARSVCALVGRWGKHCNLVCYLSHMWSASGETSDSAHAVAEVVICHCLTMEAWFQSHTSPCWTFVGYSGTGTSSSPSTGISTYQNHFTNDLYLFIHLLPILYTLSRWQCCEIMHSVMDGHSKYLPALSPIAQADVLKQCLLFQIPNDAQVQKFTVFRIFLEFTFTNQ